MKRTNANFIRKAATEHLAQTFALPCQGAETKDGRPGLDFHGPTAARPPKSAAWPSETQVTRVSFFFEKVLLAPLSGPESEKAVNELD